jgi:hypothetical protein
MPLAAALAPSTPPAGVSNPVCSGSPRHRMRIGLAERAQSGFGSRFGGCAWGLAHRRGVRRVGRSRARCLRATRGLHALLADLEAAEPPGGPVADASTWSRTPGSRTRACWCGISALNRHRSPRRRPRTCRSRGATAGQMPVGAAAERVQGRNGPVRGCFTTQSPLDSLTTALETGLMYGRPRLSERFTRRIRPSSNLAICG